MLINLNFTLAPTQPSQQMDTQLLEIERRIQALQERKEMRKIEDTDKEIADKTAEELDSLKDGM